jgi:outer membrane lipoprotein SlyB
MTEDKKSSGAGKFFLGAALGAIAGAIAGKFIHANTDDDDDECDC